MSRTRRYGTPGAGSFASNSGGESARPSGLVAERRVEGWSCSHWTYLLSFRYDHELSIRNPGRFRGISEEIFGSANLPASRDRPIGCKSYALNGFPTPGSPAERLNDVPLIRTGTGSVVNIGGFGQNAPARPPRATGPVPRDPADGARKTLHYKLSARVAKSADATDLKSVILTGVWVQFPPRAPFIRRCD